MARIAGVEIEIAEGSVLRQQPQPTVWLDTCVFLDFFTEISLNKNASAGPLSVEATRRSMQDAAWLAVAFDECRARTVVYWHEAWDNNMRTKAAPDTQAGSFPATVAHVVLDHVCPAWDGHVEHAGAKVALPEGERVTTNDERDQLIVDLCREYGMQMISTDRAALRRARAAGVSASLPAVYAERVISRPEARQRFLERLEPGLAAWRQRNSRAVLGRTAVAMIRELYESIWEPF